MTNNSVNVDELPLNFKKLSSRKNNKKQITLLVAAMALLVVIGMGVNITQPKNSKMTTTTVKSKNNNYETIEKNKNTQNSITKHNEIQENFAEDDFYDDDFLAEDSSPKAVSQIETSLSTQAGAAPVILKAVAWQVPTSISSDAIFNKYLQIAGKNIKLNLATDLLDTDEFAYNNKIKISMTVKNNAPVKNIKITESSGSKNIDEIVLQSIKQTLKYINTPVMTEDKGDREVVLVISI